MTQTLNWIALKDQKPPYGEYVYVSGKNTAKRRIQTMLLRKSNNGNYDVWYESEDRDPAIPGWSDNLFPYWAARE